MCSHCSAAAPTIHCTHHANNRNPAPLIFNKLQRVLHPRHLGMCFYKFSLSIFLKLSPSGKLSSINTSFPRPKINPSHSFHSFSWLLQPPPPYCLSPLSPHPLRPCFPPNPHMQPLFPASTRLARLCPPLPHPLTTYPPSGSNPSRSRLCRVR